MRRIFLSPPDVGDGERDAVMRALDSGWIAPGGPEVAAFEEELAARTGRARAVAVSSATAGLHLVMVALGLAAGSEVLIPTLTFIAPAGAVRYIGGSPVFLDVDEKSWNLDPDVVEHVLDERAARGRVPSAIVAVDLYGSCAAYDRLVGCCEHHGIPLIEDAAEALGASLEGRPAGSFGVAGVLSFNGNKIVTTSGGGAVVTDDAALAARVRHLANQARDPAPHYEHSEIGFNYQLSGVLAALGRTQLSDLDDRIARRAAIEDRYRATLEDRPGVTFVPRPASGTSNHWLTCAMIDPEMAGTSRDDLIRALDEADIEARPTWKPMHLQPVFAECERVINGVADRVFERGICLPSGTTMTEDDQQRVLDVLERELAP